MLCPVKQTLYTGTQCLDNTEWFVEISHFLYVLSICDKKNLTFLVIWYDVLWNLFQKKSYIARGWLCNTILHLIHKTSYYMITGVRSCIHLFTSPYFHQFSFWWTWHFSSMITVFSIITWRKLWPKLAHFCTIITT